jgi:ArsR family transcriptional regulator
MMHMNLDHIVTIHSALADPLRIRILRLLLERELCVCEMMAVLDEPQYKVSRHLRILKQAGLVRDWREGKWMHYDMNPLLDPTWRTALESLAHAWDESLEVIRADRIRLHGLSIRAPGAAVLCDVA